MELGEGSQRVQTSSDKIHRYQRCKVQHEKYNTCCMLSMKCVKRVIPEFSSKGKNFLKIPLMSYLCDMMDDVHQSY